MKVLFVIRSSDHFSYHESSISHLLSRGHHVKLIYDPGWSKSEDSVNRFLESHQNIDTGPFIRRSGFWRSIVFTTRELRSYASYLNRENQSNFYVRRWHKYQPWLLKKLINRLPFTSLLVSNPVTERFLTSFEKFVPADQKISRYLEKEAPDVLIASPVNLRFSEEVEYIKAANKIGIPTVIMVYSWDNLTTKGLYHIIPDITLAWNQTHFDEAVEIHNVPADRIVLTGAPLFDKWFNAGHLLEDRENFCQRVGIEPGLPFILYLGSSSNIAKDETWLVKDLAKTLRQRTSDNEPKYNVIVRPHPANAQIYDDLEGENLIVWPKRGALPDSISSTRDFFNSMKHSVAAVGINTSGMIDTIINGVPTLTVISEKYRETQMQAAHFKHLYNAKALDIVYSINDCVKHLDAIYHGDDRTKTNREEFLKQFVRPNGPNIDAGEYVALAVEEVASGIRDADSIQKEIILEYNPG